MDDLYSNLENYDDVNALDELRNENGKLKVKLDEYAIALEKMQKDFDRVSGEFKQLEINYSSLLKTAKAEILRKTQIITTLNIEKDAMVLKSVQNGNANQRGFRNSRQRSRVRKSPPPKHTQDTIDNPVLKTVQAMENDSGIERREENRLSSEETFSSFSPHYSNKYLKMALREKSNDDLYKPCEIKENIRKDPRTAGREPPVEKKASSIKNRRKSMPVLSKNMPKYSSDEEEDYLKVKEPFSYDDRNKRSGDRYSDYRHRRVSDLKRSSHRDPRGSGHKEHSRYHDVDSSKSKEKYSSSSFKKRVSPEKKHRKYQKDDYYKSRHERPRSKNEIYPLSDHEGYRVLETPPIDIQFSQKNRDRFGNKRDVNHEHERPRSRQGDHNSSKYRNREYDDEPAAKKSKTDTFTSYDSSKKHPEVPVTQEHFISQNVDHLFPQHTSCQSPDYEGTEVYVSTPIKEIKNTAVITLEDPRLTSKKYQIVKDHAHEFITRVSISDAEVIPVDRGLWNLERVEVPEALKQMPFENDRKIEKPIDQNQELINQIYMDVDIDVDHHSMSTMESGELSESTTDPLTEVMTEQYQRKYATRYQKHKPLPPDRRKSNLTSSKEVKSKSNADDDQQVLDKISKTSRTDDNIAVNEILPPLVVSKLSESNVNKDISEPVNAQSKQHVISKLNSSCRKDSRENATENVCRLENQSDIYNRDMVVQDLELSDETCDYTEVESKCVKSVTNNEVRKKDIESDNKRSSKRVSQRRKTSTRDTSKERLKDKVNNKTNKKDSEFKNIDSRHDKLIDVTKSKCKGSDTKHVDIETTEENESKTPKCKASETKQDKNEEIKPKTSNSKSKEVKQDKKDEIKPKASKATESKHNQDEIEEIKSKIKEVEEQLNKELNKKQTKSKKPENLVGKSSKELEKVIDKEDKTQKETSTPEMKSKFKDLFGDSNSLITLEDLNLAPPPAPRYLPIFEDAQDAVDLTDTLAAGTSQHVANEGETINKEATEDVKTKCKKGPKNKPENKRRSKSISVDPEVPASVAAECAAFRNVCPAAAPDVVRTVVISAGVQPRAGDEAEFATSTPYKVPTPPTVAELHTDSKMSSSLDGSSRDDSQVGAAGGAGGAAGDDAPVVRIHVTRRKRKRAP